MNIPLIIAWPASLGLIAWACGDGWFAAKARGRCQGIGASAVGCAAFCVLGIAGALDAFPAAVLALVTLIPAAALSVSAGWRGSLREITGEAGASFGRLGRFVFHVTLRAGDSKEERRAGRPVPVAEALAAREIPPLRADPHLGAPAEPAEIAAAAPVPAPYAALAQYIAQCEPADDVELRMFMEGDAAGQIAISEARQAFADHCLNGAGLAPAYVAGILEVSDAEAEVAALKVQAHRRFGVIYRSVKEWVAAHGPLPHRARQFLSGEDAA